MEQGKSEILKILESATDREYYYNCKKRKVLFDNNINKRLQSYNNPPKTKIKTNNPEIPQIANETNINSTSKDEKTLECINRRQKDAEESSRNINKLIYKYHESVIKISHLFQEFLAKLELITSNLKTTNNIMYKNPKKSF